MLYSCPTPACVEVVRERARMLKQDESTPNRAPDLAADIAKRAIDYALSCASQVDGQHVRADMVRSAATMIQAVERFDAETQAHAQVHAVEPAAVEV